MIIQSLERGFAVIKIVESQRDMDILICKDLLEDQESRYMLISIKNPDLIYKSMPFFTEQTENNSFSDLVECFSQNGNFYIVFKYKEKERLYEKIETEVYSLREKLEIIRNMFSEITLQDMPAAIQYEGLQRRNLLLDDSLSVFFNYDLREIKAYSIMPESRMQTEAAAVLRTVFDVEIEAKSVKVLEDFITTLEIGGYKKYIDIYQEYDKVYQEILHNLEEDKVQPQGFLFRLWEKMKLFWRKAKPAFLILVVGIVFIYMFYNALKPQPLPASAKDIKQIGTVMIEEEK
ncbi:hypothetical protein [Aminipila terrae]|uniref:Uncharacterized protein n=1 Tax=Aminipila terrae TaxID=2697030 RepID=A0A6P1MLS2_9FIRM|nr:hypothetical protein [Aminipila terrae]QHI72596.1 hypothetical protein Ami3637_09460 [Aminipila terrae]